MGKVAGLIALSQSMRTAGRYLDAVAPAEQAVTLCEQLAGSPDYSRLGDFTPNQHWPYPNLAHALWNLGHAYQAVGRDMEALAIIGQQVKLLERLGTDDDHAAWRAAHDEEKVFWRNAGMPPGPSPQAAPDTPQQRVAGPVAALSRNPNQIDIFGVGHDGWVHSNWWTANTWHEWFRIGDKVFPPQTPVTALSRDDDFMDIFAVGRDLGVHSSWWNGNPWRPWFRIGTKAFPERTPITALSRNTNQMDLFAVAQGGLVHNAWWNGNPWRNWTPIGTMSFPELTPITAVSRNPNQMDLFAVGPDKRIYNAWWNGNWSGWIPIGTHTFPHGATIAAICRTSDFMDLFAVDENGIMHSAGWNGSWHEWFPIDGQTFRPGTPVAALTRNSDQMDIFAVGADDRVHSSWWNGNPWRPWFPMSERRFPPATVISGVVRSSDHMDLFATGADGRVCFAKWNGNPWLGWYPISVVPRRPFYVIAHNPNSPSTARKAIRGGANALGPDINLGPLSGGQRRLVVAHDVDNAGIASPLEDYLAELSSLAQEYPHFALVVFDIKSAAATPEYGLEILTQVRRYLAGTQLNIVFSVPKLANTAAFNKIVPLLGPREGLMIDEENNAGDVFTYFNALGVANQGYGNGISPFNRVTGPYYRKTLEAACTFRAQLGHPRFVVSWTNNTKESMREYIDIGVDGIITDDIGDLQQVLQEAGPLGLVRMAARADNPFQPDNRAFGLTIDTSDKWRAGTDANVTFTLLGTEDMATKTINAGLMKHLESGGWDYVTIPCLDIGTLKSIIVSHDGTGINPDWHLNRIDIASERYHTHQVAIFNRWVEDEQSERFDF